MLDSNLTNAMHIQDTVIIPASSFYAPYWVLNLMLFGVFMAGLIIGIGSTYGWRQLYFRISMILSEISL